MRAIEIVERVALILAFIGVLLIFQPFTHQLLLYGFLLVGLGGFIYVYTTYLPRNPISRITVKTIVRWIITLVGVVVFFVVLSINLAPLLV
jgi:hypothetical protein